MSPLQIAADAQRASAADALAAYPGHIYREMAHAIDCNVDMKVVIDAAVTGDKAVFARAFAAAGHLMTPAVEMMYLAARMYHCEHSNPEEPELLRPEFDIARLRALDLLSDPANTWLCEPRLHFAYRPDEDADWPDEDDYDQAGDTAPLISCGLFSARTTRLKRDMYDDATPDFPPALVASSEFARALTAMVKIHVRFAGPVLPDFTARHFDPEALLDAATPQLNPGYIERMLFPACAAADAAAIVMWDRLLERCSASPAFADLARVTARAVDMGHMMNQIINQDRGSFESVVAKIAKLNRLAGASSEGEYGGLSRKSFWSGIVTAQAARSVNRPFHEIAPTAFACLMQAAIDHDVAPEMIVTFELEANFWNFEPTDETAEISFIEALGKGVDGSSAAMFLAMRIKADMERQIGARAAQHDPPGLRRRRAV